MSSLIILIVLAILPGYYLGKKIYERDIDKEPKKLLTKIVIFGALICIPAAFLEVYVEDYFVMNDDYISYIWYFTIGIALIEEVAKFIPVYFLGLKSKFFDDIYDAIVYTAFSALGFATFENLFYIFGESGGLSTAILRLIFSVPGHIGYGVMMGYFIGLAYNAKSQGNNNKYLFNMVLSILIPTLFHGLYDAVISFGAEQVNVVGIIIAFGIDLYITIYAFKQTKNISKSNEKLDSNNELHNVTKKLVTTICMALLVCGLVCNASFLNWASLIDTTENVYTDSIQEYQSNFEY